MLIRNIKNAIRNRCNNSPAITAEFILSSAIQVMQDLSLKAQVIKNNSNITLTPDTYEYDLGQFTLACNKVEYGTADELAENIQTTLRAGIDYETIWYNNVLGTAPQSLKIRLKWNPSPDKILRIYTNDFNDAASTLDFSTANNFNNLNQIIAPVCEQAIIDGVVAFYKLDFERNPTSQASVSKYSDTLTEIASLFNERVENP